MMSKPTGYFQAGNEHDALSGQKTKLPLPGEYGISVISIMSFGGFE